jgi:hypothetical protein
VKKVLITIVVFGALGAGVLFIKHAIAAPARATERNLAAINGLTVGTTTEVELLARKEFQTVERRCFQSDCQYLMETENTFLNRLRLAPVTVISIVVRVREGLVNGVLVFTRKAGLPAITVSQVVELPSGCSSSPCVKRRMLPNKTFLGISIVFSSESDIRNHMPEAVNSACLSRLHGCNTYADLMPITKELNLEAAGR